jgi:cation:H+ antiporter
VLDAVYVLGGITLIILSANWLVTGASAFAKRFGVSDLVIGLTIVGLGTSAPELTVNLFSAIKGSTDIAIGNILGSNIANILLILGLSAAIFPITISNTTKWKEIPFSLLAILVLAIVSNDIFLNGADKNMISRGDGAILICFILIFIVYAFEMARKEKINSIPAENKNSMPIWKSIALIFVGLVGLFFGGKYLVDGAIQIARVIGMSEKVIGLTIIAIGTSVPELATSVVAAFKKNTDIAIGNVIGSNIFNVFFILGTTATIRPLPFDVSINFDVFIAMLASVLLFLTTVTIGQKRITRLEGLIFVALYISYILYSIVK